jgi:hypothetical protein
MEPGVQTEGRRRNFASILIEFQAMCLVRDAACNPVADKAHRTCYSRMRFIGPIAGVARFPR